MQNRSRLSPGERAPDFVMTGPGGTPARFYAFAGGRPLALVLGDESDDVHAEISARLAPRSDLAVVRIDRDTAATVFGVADGSRTVIVLDPNLRVVAEVSVSGDSDPGPADEVTALLEQALPSPSSREVREQAPVLFVPRVLDPSQRARLIDVWHSSGEEATGVEQGSSGGVRASQLDQSFKRRRDHTVTDADLLRELSASIGRRVMPEIQKAFAFRARRFEGFKIGCYDASTGGFFRAHRDNVSPSTAHRVFALTLNLNDEYEGGQLRFPEYGRDVYRPDAGAALIFSCSHLHEVCEVTQGRRFVLLSFLYTDPLPPATP